MSDLQVETASKRMRMNVFSNGAVARVHTSGAGKLHNGYAHQNGDVHPKAGDGSTDEKRFNELFATLVDQLSRVDDPATSDAMRWLKRVSFFTVFPSSFCRPLSSTQGVCLRTRRLTLRTQRVLSANIAQLTPQINLAAGLVKLGRGRF